MFSSNSSSRSGSSINKNIDDGGYDNTNNINDYNKITTIIKI